MKEFKLQLLGKIYNNSNNNFLANKSNIKGCSPEEIISLMRVQYVDYLPSIYKDFLLTVGKNLDVMFRGSDFTYNRLLVLKEALAENFNLDTLEGTPYEDVFVFMDHQGYVKYFFHTIDKITDPIVYVAVEDEISSCEFTLSEFLLQEKQC